MTKGQLPAGVQTEHGCGVRAVPPSAVNIQVREVPLHGLARRGGQLHGVGRAKAFICKIAPQALQKVKDGLVKVVANCWLPLLREGRGKFSVRAGGTWRN